MEGLVHNTELKSVFVSTERVAQRRSSASAARKACSTSAGVQSWQSTSRL